MVIYPMLSQHESVAGFLHRLLDERPSGLVEAGTASRVAERESFTDRVEPDRALYLVGGHRSAIERRMHLRDDGLEQLRDAMQVAPVMPRRGGTLACLSRR